MQAALAKHAGLVMQDRVSARAHRHALDHEVLHSLDQPPLDVPCAGCFDSCINQPLSPSHGMEEQLLYQPNSRCEILSYVYAVPTLLPTFWPIKHDARTTLQHSCLLETSTNVNAACIAKLS